MSLVPKEIKLAELVRMYPAFMTGKNADDIAVADIEFEGPVGLFQHPCRFDGYLTILCTEGSLGVDLNLKSFSLEKDSLFVYEPSNILRFYRSGQAPDLPVRLRMTAISMEFIREVEKDIARLYTSSVAVHEDPCLSFSGQDVVTVNKFYELTESLVRADIPGCKEALHSLVAAVIFFFQSFWMRKRQDRKGDYPAHSARVREKVDEFIRLVTEHHMTEHYLAFYAEKLGITPKYLSKLVRDVTGRSAPDWIDSFLVLEAKNMLKYSDMAIKEIVYEMHFPDQSSFYKFFKLHTGMIPSEYRKL